MSVPAEIKGMSDYLGLDAYLHGGMEKGEYLRNLEKIILYLLVRASDGNLNIYDEARIMALINPNEHKKLTGYIERIEADKKEKAKAAA